ncbi:MAG: hypothetical protein RLZZ210_901 [Pseudomonadota bacterium]|jgi:uncharacterized membrane protein YebE (DUF533 family)
MKAKIILGLVSSLFAISAFAHMPEIHRSQHRQQHRIAEGINSGQLTAKEAMRLERGQARIQHMKRVAKADGVVTHEERARIRHAQHRQSQKIYEKKHNLNTQHNTY